MGSGGGLTVTENAGVHERQGFSELVSYGVVLAAGVFGASWAFLGGFYNEFGLTPAEVGVGYEDAVVTMVVFASTLGFIAATVAMCLIVATGMRHGSTWLRLVAVALVTLAVVAVVGAMNEVIGPPTRWVIYSLLTTAAASVSLATWGRTRPRYMLFIAVSTYLLWLPYVRQLGGSLSELVPTELNDPRTTLVPRWPTVVCAMPSGSQLDLPPAADWTEPWLYFGNQDGTVILARSEFEETVLIRLPTESVYLVTVDNANKVGNYYYLDCSTEGLLEEFDT